MSGIFDLDHLSTPVGTGGASIGLWDSIEQAFDQQYKVDSPLSLENEVQTSWLENIEKLEAATGQRFEMPENLSDYQTYLRLQRGEPAEFNRATSYKTPEERLAMFQKADEAIRALGDPNIRTFGQVLEGVFLMQQKVEERTAEVAERGSTIGSFIGAAAGSFTTRDPLNIYSLPVGGFGRTAAWRIASEMGVAGAVTGVDEAAFVNPNRERAGLGARSVVYDAIAAGVGAGVFRGGLEGLGAAARRVRGANTVDVALDFKDDQLRQMFAADPTSPRARAGEELLDVSATTTKANPYGDGAAAEARFLAELQDVQRVLGGAPETAVARFLPPLPDEAIEKNLDFKLVKEQSPEVYGRMEAARAQVADFDSAITQATQPTTVVDAVRLVNEPAADALMQLEARVNDLELPEPVRVAADMEAATIIRKVGEDKILGAQVQRDMEVRTQVQRLRAQKRAANKRYREAYAAVDREATRLREQKQQIERLQQRDAVDLLGYSTKGQPFLMPMLRHEAVGARFERIAADAEAIPERAVAMSRVTPDEEGMVDIGLAKPVPASFRFAAEMPDGSVREMSIQEALDDLMEDELLEEAMKGCML